MAESIIIDGFGYLISLVSFLAIEKNHFACAGSINKYDYSNKIEVSETYNIGAKITMFALSSKEDHLYMAIDNPRLGEGDVENGEVRSP